MLPLQDLHCFIHLAQFVPIHFQHKANQMHLQKVTIPDTG